MSVSPALVSAPLASSVEPTSSTPPTLLVRSDEGPTRERIGAPAWGSSLGPPSLEREALRLGAPRASSGDGPGAYAEDAAVRALASLLPALSSAEVLFAAIERADARLQSDGLHLEAQDALERERGAEAHRAEARAQADKAERRARRALASAPKWVRKLVKAILVVAAAAASVCTGGVAGGLAVAGLALSLAAPKLEQLASKLGLDSKAAHWIGIACRIAGAALAASIGGALAPSMLTEVAHAAAVVRDVVGAASSVVRGARELVGAHHTRTAEHLTMQEARDALDARFECEVLSDVVARLRELVVHAERVARAASEWLEVRDATRHAVASSLG